MLCLINLQNKRNLTHHPHKKNPERTKLEKISEFSPKKGRVLSKWNYKRTKEIYNLKLIDVQWNYSMNRNWWRGAMLPFATMEDGVRRILWLHLCVRRARESERGHRMYGEIPELDDRRYRGKWHHHLSGPLQSGSRE